MNENLSSSMTYWYKIGLPVFWIICFGSGTIALWLDKFDQPSPQPPSEVKFMFLAAFVIGSVFLLRDTFRLKQVAVENENLKTRNFIKTICVPLHDVKYISESKMVRPKTVTVLVYPKCQFGKKIVFIPKAKFQMTLNPFKEHPIVARLHELSGLKKQ